MTGTSFLQWKRIGRLAVAALISISMAFSTAVAPASAATERALYLYYTHTKETARIVFKRDGRYVQSGLDQLNQFLRDWRRNEPAKMDPRLFDLVWEVYQEVGGSQPINVVSAYRSPQTNAMLRSNSSGVAENSQHMRGTAMDFFIPGIPLPRLRAAAMRKQVGGVGYYPTSGSPFVHLDTGSVRAWPRMTRAQLQELFPDGRTMHLPTDGKPLSQEGYQLAQAEWQRCHSVPCGDSSSGTRVASSGGGGGTLMDMLFGGNNDNQQQQQVASAPQAPAPQQAAPVAVAAAAPAATPGNAPTPAMRPAELGGQSMQVAQAGPAAIPFSTTGSAPLDPSEMVAEVIAPVPLMKSETLRVATAGTLPGGDAVTALAALTQAPTPMPPRAEEAETLTAYLPTGPAQQDIEALIASAPQVQAAAFPPTPGLRGPILASTGAPVTTASIAPQADDAMAGLFAGTFEAAGTAQASPLADALSSHIAGQQQASTATPAPAGMRQPVLISPDLEHVADVFMTPSVLTSSHFAVIFDHDQADFDPTTEMGRHVTVMGVGDDTTVLGNARFAPRAIN